MTDKLETWWRVDTDAPDEGSVWAPDKRAFAEADVKKLRRKGHKAWIVPIVHAPSHPGPSWALH